MSTRTKTLPIAHTAGIFSDMSTDGPEIGMLVLVVDRAKNLPNRKTIGKQDPYCAARLGKEAKKTNTDIRGGQTPKWDQELRFTVHDSPDYFQLKVSVFNDDKKTELIGEAWIDLRDIIVDGGGQSDQWHQLQCRGKYAGELRLELTYYDNQPKPDKTASKSRNQQSVADIEQQSETAPVAATGPRAMPRRRPLPSDPVAGKTPSPAPTSKPPPVPASAPEPVETPPRSQPNLITSYVPSQSPLQQAEYGSQSSRYQQQQLPPPPDHYPRQERTVDRRREPPPPQQYQTPERADRYPGQQQLTYDRYDPRSSDPYITQQENAAEFSDDRPPPPPAHRSRPSLNSAPNTGYQGTPPTMRQDVLRNEAHRASASPSSYPGRPTYKAADSAPAALPGSQYQALEQPPQPRHYSYDTNGYDQSHRGMQATVEDVPESPESSNSYRRSMGRAPQDQSQAQYDLDFENTSPAPLNISGRRPSNAMQDQQYSTSPGMQDQRYSTSPGLQDQRYSTSPGMQDQRYSTSPGVQDPRYSSSPGVQDQRYSTSPGMQDQRYSTSPGIQDQPGYQASNGYVMSSTDLSRREPSDYSSSSNYGRHSEPNLPSYDSQQNQRALPWRDEPDNGTNTYSAAPVPAALIPGIDPNISQEIAVRVNEDSGRQRRYNQPTQMETPPRGRTMDVARRYDHDGSAAGYNAQPPAHGRNPMTYTAGPSTSSVNVVIKSRAYSPNPPVRDPSPNPPQQHHNPPQQQHTIRRKSVSPRPPSSDSRAMSSVPFGPDSYEVLNPTAAAAAMHDPTAALPDYDAATGKIITHDGREVDPSDHLPMDTWAPEPEPKKSAPASPAARPSPAGPQPLPASSTSRRPLRITAGPRPPSYVAPDSFDSVTPSPPASNGRNRLQKKPPHRMSISGFSPSEPVMSGANGPGPRRNSNVGMDSQPLAPLPPHQDNFNPPRHLPRASTFDYGAGENYHPSVQQGGRNGPPPPAKIPLALPPVPGYNGNMSGALQLHSSSAARRGGMDDYDHYDGGYRHQNDGYGGGGGRELSLEEELRQIDIGTGRSSRRHQGYATHQGQW
ncbi:hypothetical protein QBC40DRAFT_339120 [Triangularia verruculosa]|uniref:C2 domain-containing protein n=1 Tax=Triangularia verruculosa TaxID=2587418 RepID=A0AAN6XIV5_9PEZI|nr:hypothetical protein QBC40DRAFT_339120 [Triangularia verruculosa]